MSNPIPKSLVKAENQQVLEYLDGKSAHSDLREMLNACVQQLGDVQEYCPDPSKYAYALLSTKDIVFAFAVNTNSIGVRLDEVFFRRALECGLTAFSELDRGWVCLQPFRPDYPSTDLPFWLRKAYVFARASKKSQ